jgi:hypothetical protein
LSEVIRRRIEVQGAPWTETNPNITEIILYFGVSFVFSQVLRIQAICFAMLLAGLYWASGCGGGYGGATNSTQMPVSITAQPASQAVTVGQTATFSVMTTGTPPLTYQWQKNGTNISGATATSYTTPATASTDNGTTFDVVVSNYAGGVTSAMATLTVNPIGVTSALDVVTYHYDNQRTGQNLNETTLTTANVTQSRFGKLGELIVDGKVDAQPLYLSNVSVPGVGMKNVLYVATEHGSVFAFDADNVSGTAAKPLWQITTQLSGEKPSDDRGCGQVTPEIGITSTPVIDRTRGAIYVVSVSKDASGNYFHRIHALDITTGKELFGGPTTVTATFPGNGAGSAGGTVTFDPSEYNERPGLLELNGTIYTTWGSHCDAGPYTSWVMAYSADTLKQTGVLNLVPNGSDGGIWMAGTAPAADSAGNIYFLIGNGTFDTTLNASGLPSQKDCGNCFVKISPATLTLLDYFTPSNTVAESNADEDLGSGGPLLLPDVTDASGKTRHLAVGSGKDKIIYVLDRDAMGKFSATQNNIYQQISGQLAGAEFAKPSYFNGTVYYGAVSDSLKAFPITAGKLAASPSSKTAAVYAYPGATPAISANVASNGIVWAVENGATGVLHAYDATNLATELYNSNQASGSRDQFSDNKFITPMIANGKVFVGTANSVAVFGLL